MKKKENKFLKMWDKLKKIILKKIDIGINSCISGLVIYFIIIILNNIDYKSVENLFEIVSQYFYNKEYGLSFIAIVSLLLCSLYTLKRYNEWLKFIIIFWVALISFIGYLFLKLLGTNLSSWLNISLYVILFCILSFVVFYCVFLINKFFSRSNRTKIKDARKTSTSEQNADNAKISESENYDKLVGLAFKSLCFSLVFGFIYYYNNKFYKQRII